MLLQHWQARNQSNMVFNENKTMLRSNSTRKPLIVGFLCGLLLSLLFSSGKRNRGKAGSIALKYSKWKEGFAVEEKFWNYIMETKGKDYSEGREFQNRTSKKTEAVDQVLDMLGECVPIRNASKPHVRVLDVGAGPFSTLATRNAKYEIELTPVDPLAPIYDKLLRKHNIVPPVRTQYCRAEGLRDCFHNDEFHLVHIRNALDHTQNPMDGILQMLSVVAPGCNIWLVHNTNEAENESYQGFHQWNLDVQNGRFVIWRPGVQIDVQSELGDYAQISLQLAPDGKYFQARIKKSA